MDFDMLTGPLTVWELSCIEMGDNLCTDANMEFDLIYVHFPHISDLKWIFSNIKINFESIGGVVFAHTWTHLLLNEQFMSDTLASGKHSYVFCE